MFPPPPLYAKEMQKRWTVAIFGGVIQSLKVLLCMLAFFIIIPIGAPELGRGFIKFVPDPNQSIKLFFE